MTLISFFPESFGECLWFPVSIVVDALGTITILSLLARTVSSGIEYGESFFRRPPSFVGPSR